MIAWINSLSKKFANREIVSYLIIGCVTTCIGVGGFVVFSHLGFSVFLSNTISTVIAVLFAFVANKLFVFHSHNLRALFVIKELVLFVSGRFFSYSCETLLLILSVDIGGLDKSICKIFTSILVIILNYVISKKKVFPATTGNTQKQ